MCDQRIINALAGKTASSGGLNIPELRKLAIDMGITAKLIGRHDIVEAIKQMYNKADSHGSHDSLITGKWTSHETMYYSLDEIDHALSMHCFDFDNTLVKLRTSEHMFENVSAVLAELSVSANIVVFSNQKGIGSGKTTNREVQALMNTFRASIKPVRISFFMLHKMISIASQP